MTRQHVRWWSKSILTCFLRQDRGRACTEYYKWWHEASSRPCHDTIIHVRVLCNVQPGVTNSAKQRYIMHGTFKKKKRPHGRGCAFPFSRRRERDISRGGGSLGTGEVPVSDKRGRRPRGARRKAKYQDSESVSWQRPSDTLAPRESSGPTGWRRDRPSRPTNPTHVAGGGQGMILSFFFWDPGGWSFGATPTLTLSSAVALAFGAR